MLQLLHPIWLIAMAGIAFPVIIHLWNDKQGKVLPVGSIAFLEKGSRKQARSRRLSEWWLLLLRCLLLLLLGLLLAAPFWENHSSQKMSKGWVLGVKDSVALKTYGPLIDSLLKAGYQWHEWGSGSQSPGIPPSYWDLFRIADRQAPEDLPFYVFTSGRRAGFTGARPVSGRVVHWMMETSSADSAHQWIEQAWLDSPDGIPSNSIPHGSIPPDSIHVLTGNSSPTGISYSLLTLPAKMEVSAAAPAPGTNRVAAGSGTYHVEAGKGYLSIALDSQPPVIVDTETLHIRIYADDKYSNDSRYLVAAIHALQSFTRKNIQVSIAGNLPAADPASPVNPAAHPDQAAHPDRTPRPVSSPGPARAPDWLFWLSSAPVPAGLPAHNIVRYVPGKEISVDSWIQGLTGIPVNKRVEPDSGMQAESAIQPGSTRHAGYAMQPDAPAAADPVCLKDGFGRPLLSMQSTAGRRVFYFFSHFDPAWNGLVWSPRFPMLLQDLFAYPACASKTMSDPFLQGPTLANLVFVGSEKVSAQDLRLLDPQQVLPQKIAPGAISGALPGAVTSIPTDAAAGTPQGAAVLPGTQGVTDLAPVCWILLFLLFLAERMFSLRSPKTNSYG